MLFILPLKRHVLWPSQVEISGASPALRQHPLDVLVRVADVAGLSVHAVLRVDDGSRLFAVLLHPFVDAGRTEARRRAGIDVGLGAFLQIQVLHLDRLILLVVGIRRERRGEPVGDRP